jgi:ribosomal protein S18 acetylase RimI-like enzyme
MMACLYTTHILTPDQPNLLHLARKTASLRLEGLLQSPDSFSSSYDEEVLQTDVEELEKLKRSKRTTVIAAQAGTQENWTQAAWAGQVTLLGPLTREEYLAPFLQTHQSEHRLSLAELDATFPPVSAKDTEATYWHMTALFVLCDHRRQGLGDQLCKKAFEYIEERRGSAGSELRIIIKPSNGAVIKLYERLGFEALKGNSTLAEAIVASEGTDALPDDHHLQKAFLERNGLIMVKRQTGKE